MRPIDILQMRKSGTGALGSLSATLTSGRISDSVTYWDTGFTEASGSTETANTITAIGSLSATALGSATVKGIYWKSASGYGSSDSPVFVEISGNQASGAFTSLLVDAVSMGTVTRVSYDAGNNCTTFSVGGVRANPFGGNGSNHTVTFT